MSAANEPRYGSRRRDRDLSRVIELALLLVAILIVCFA